MNKRNLSLYLFLVGILICSTGFDSIGNSLKPIQVMIENSKLFMIFKNESEQELLFDSGTLFINGQNLDDTGIHSISDSEIPLTTLFLVDVTKTVLYSETARVTESAEVFRTNPVFSASGRSRFFLQTFGDVVSQVSGPSEDPITLVSDIKYEDNTSDYFYALSEAVDFLKARVDSGIAEKQQIIIFTDAMRFSETTNSESQLKDKLRKAGIPVYGIALYNTNTELVNRQEVNKLLELAEISGGTVLIPKDYSGSTSRMTNEIIRKIVSCYVASGLVNDGIIRSNDNTYSVSLIIDNQGNRIADIPYSAVLALPVLPTATPEPTDIPTETPEPTNTPVPTETPIPTETLEIFGDAESNPDEEGIDNEKKWIDKETEIGGHKATNKLLLFTGIGIFVLIIGIISIVVSTRKKKLEREKAARERAREIAHQNSRDKLMMGKMVPSIGISLSRVGAPGSVPIRAKLMENEEVKFGRIPAPGVVGLEDDDTISIVHFKLVYTNGFIYIEDMASSNGVIINGSKLTQRARLNNGDHLLLGNVTYQVQIISSNVSFMKRG